MKRKRISNYFQEKIRICLGLEDNKGIKRIGLEDNKESVFIPEIINTGSEKLGHSGTVKQF